MQSLNLSFQAVTPIFLLMALGYSLKQLKVCDKNTFDNINKLVFKVFLPTLLFYNIYSNDTPDVFDAKLVAFSIVGIICVFLVGLISVFFVTKDNKKRGAMLQGFFRSNFAILGIPLIKYVCPTSPGAITSLMVAIIVPVFNVLAVIALEIFRGQHINFKKILKGIITNPLIIGCLLGLICFLSDIKFYSVIETTLKDISKIASPLAIIVLGAGFEFSHIKGYLKENIIVVTTRLILVPLIILPIGAYLGFFGEAFMCLMVIFASPVAVSSYAMAKQMDSDEKLAGQVVVLSSAFCIVTLFIWIYIFSHFNVI